MWSFTRILDPKIKSGGADLFMNVRGARDFREGRAKSVAGLVALDRHTVQVTLDEALAPFVAVLAVGHAKIVPRDLVEAQGETFGAQPVGTGPFKFARWERGKEIALTANADYFDAPPRVSQLVFRIFPGEQRDAMYEEFRQGNLEDSPVPTRADRRMLAGGPYTYVKRPMISVKFYGFNTRVKPLNDRRVRQAILYAVNREALVQDVYYGQFTHARGILPPGTLGFNPKLAGYPYDPHKARSLLAEAGYGGGRGRPTLAIWSAARRDVVVREHEEIKR